jgi:hypothetical protein
MFYPNGRLSSFFVLFLAENFLFAKEHFRFCEKKVNWPAVPHNLPKAFKQK